jgi:alkanesulfonate monooxygenase SsuD/methylene tetrahydromethanopterin reductase-like flavin-dependent oxidoreductase (luciferase family)
MAAAVRVNLMVEGQEGVSWGQWVALAQAVERAGLEGLFRSDHYLSILRGAPAGALDAWVTLGALAAVTERIHLGTLVSPVTFRHPSVLAKNVVTADHVSGGRVELGIGGGWYEAEHTAYGFWFGSARERMDELDRQLTEIHRQWVEADDIYPKPLQQPRPHLIVGGSAKRRTVHAAVRFADEYNTTFASPEECRERRRRVDDAARASGREPLTFSVMTGCVVARDQGELDGRLGRLREITGRDIDSDRIVIGTTGEVVERLREYEAAGVERVMLQHLVHEDVEMVDVLGEVAAALR